MGFERAVVVTGANAGIGRALAKRLVEEGHPVVLIGRRKAAGEEVLAELSALPSSKAALVIADLATAKGRADAIVGVCREAQTIAALVHNAGLWPTRLELTEEGFERSYVVN